jgi:hypothetical protein
MPNLFSELNINHLKYNVVVIEKDLAVVAFINQFEVITLHLISNNYEIDQLECFSKI